MAISKQCHRIGTIVSLYLTVVLLFFVKFLGHTTYTFLNALLSKHLVKNDKTI